MNDITPEQDLHERWLPTESAVRHAVALLKAEPRADLAAIPMYQPGKTYGIWTVGQEVQTVPGVVFIGVNSFKNTPEVPSFSWARAAAEDVARTFLKGPGTVAYALVRSDGSVAVFENFGGEDA